MCRASSLDAGKFSLFPCAGLRLKTNLVALGGRTSYSVS